MSPCPHTYTNDNKIFLIGTRTWLLLVGKTSRADLAQREHRSRCGVESVVWEGSSWPKCQGLSLKQRQSECLRMSWGRWSGLGLFKEGICLYMWASFNLFFHSSNIYWSLYLSGFSRETGVCVCVCVCVYTCTHTEEFDYGDWQVPRSSVM